MLSLMNGQEDEKFAKDGNFLVVLAGKKGGKIRCTEGAPTGRREGAPIPNIMIVIR